LQRLLNHCTEKLHLNIYSHRLIENLGESHLILSRMTPKRSNTSQIPVVLLWQTHRSGRYIILPW